jgi:superfamily II DNA or RNA helicase
LLIQSSGDPVTTPPEVFQILHPHLSFAKRDFLYGMASRDPNTGKKRRVEITHKRLYGTDGSGRLYTGFGFLRRCYNALKSAGFSINYVDWDAQFEAQNPRPLRYTPNLDNVRRCFEFRPRQLECLQAVMSSQHGVIHAVTGYGKRIMIAMICLLYPKAKIHIVLRSAPLVRQTVDELTRYLPNIGQVGAGKKMPGNRITVFTRDSLHCSDLDADFLLGDEAHELVTDKSSPILSRYQKTRNFALTATPTGRSDGTDPRLECTFGPTIFYIPYWEAVELGLVVPIRVEWKDVILDHNPAKGVEDIERHRRGIWFNHERNNIIANDVLNVPQDEQFLVLTDTVFHAVELFRRTCNQRERELVLVYDKIDIDRFKAYKDFGVLPDNVHIMTSDRKEEYRKRFEAGDIDAIATKTWEVGIDPVYLQYLFVAASFRSEIKAQQAPGRASRINKEGKSVGIIRDYRDQFDENLCDAARERFRIYGTMRWEQVLDTDDGPVPLLKSSWR